MSAAVAEPLGTNSSDSEGSRFSVLDPQLHYLCGLFSRDDASVNGKVRGFAYVGAPETEHGVSHLVAGSGLPVVPILKIAGKEGLAPAVGVLRVPTRDAYPHPLGSDTFNDSMGAGVQA